MNSSQRKVLIFVVVLIVAMLLYPPWQAHLTNSRGASVVVNHGYSWIISPPQNTAQVNVVLLFTQWVGVLIVGLILYFMMRNR